MMMTVRTRDMVVGTLVEHQRQRQHLPQLQLLLQLQGSVTTMATADEFVPDMQKRTLMNLILLGSVALTVGGLGGPFLYYFYPAGIGGGGGGLIAKDALGDDVTFAGWTAKHGPGDRALVQGLKGDATYLIVKDDKTIETFGINAVCTHLGCVVPWNKAA